MTQPTLEPVRQFTPSLEPHRGVTPQDEPTIWDVINPLLRYRRWIVAVPVLITVAIGIWVASGPLLWRSTASFLPTTAGGRSALSGLAQQFGFDLGRGGGDQGQSSAFYERLLTSRELLRSVVTTEMRQNTESGPRTVTLIELFEIPASSPPVNRREAAVGKLIKATSVSIDPPTGLVEITVKLPWPEVSQQTAARMIELVNEFNGRRMRSLAAAGSDFTAQMVDSAERALRLAENRLQAFLQRNRAFGARGMGVPLANAPQLQFEFDRLNREVELRSSVYTSLATSYEQLRIDAMRDTPLITVVETPVVPVAPASNGLLLKTMATFVLTAFTVTIFALLFEFFSRSRQREPNQYAQFLRLRDQAIADVRRLWWPFRRTASLSR